MTAPDDTDAVERSITIRNELGLHARAATKFVQIAGKYPCDIVVEKDGHEVNGAAADGCVTDDADVHVWESRSGPA